MPRYIDADKLIDKIFPIGLIDDGNYTINAKAVKVAIDKMPTADVVPKSEVEQLKQNLEQCENGYRQEMHLLQCKLADEKSKVREIFALIWDAFQSTYYDSEFEEKFDKIEKKYTESEGND